MLIIHGEDSKKSYDRFMALLDEVKKRGQSILDHEGKDLSVLTLSQELNSSDLFANRPFIVLRNFLATPKSKLKDGLLHFLSSSQFDDLLLYESKEITPAQLKALPSAKVEIYKVDSEIFKLMDAIRPRNFAHMSRLFGNILAKGYAAEYVFTMLLRQIRLLIQAKSDPTLIKLPPYPKKLLQSQSGQFTLEKLIDLHHELYLIDKKIKTGATQIEMEHLLFSFFSSI